MLQNQITTLIKSIASLAREQQNHIVDIIDMKLMKARLFIMIILL